MKLLHRPDLYAWSRFDEERNIDFHSVAWVRADGNVLVDPLPLTPHDEAHLDQLGGAELIIVTNGHHARDSERIAARTKARIAGARAERESFPIACQEWLADGDEPVPGLRVLELEGSKTPGELALLLEGDTLITGDLIRCHEGGRLCLLPPAKLSDPEQAITSVRRLLDFPEISAVLPGDGWPLFRGGHAALRELVAEL